MPHPATAADQVARDRVGRGWGYHRLRVNRVIPETADACSVELEIPDELTELFRYEAGQFCTFRAEIGGVPVVRCYSMSSSPEVDTSLRVTVKRVVDGAMSNWVNDTLSAGDVIEVAPPSGFFQLTSGGGDIVAFAAGSGITPIFSLIKTALATTNRRVRLFYANRDRESVIFAAPLDALAAADPGRLTIEHHVDLAEGFVTPAKIGAFATSVAPQDIYMCGPGPFMDIVEGAVSGTGATIHIERFTPADLPPDPVGAEPIDISVTVEIGGRTGTLAHRPGTTLLQVARELGLSPPYSCESGSCATCMAQLVEGEVTMRVNNALTPDEVAEGWVLTCQSVPVTPKVHVVYEGS